MQCWEQTDINLAGAREVAVAEAEAKRMGWRSDGREEKEDSRDGAPEENTRSELK